MQGVFAGLPFGMPGMGDEMEGAMQQAPQFGRQFICLFWHRYVDSVVTFFKSKPKAWVVNLHIVFNMINCLS